MSCVALAHLPKRLVELTVLKGILSWHQILLRLTELVAGSAALARRKETDKHIALGVALKDIFCEGNNPRYTHRGDLIHIYAHSVERDNT